MYCKTMMQTKKLLLPAAILLTFFLGFEAGGFHLVLLRVAQEFSFDNKFIGSLVAVQYAAIIIFPLIFGNLSDRIGKKKVLLLFVFVFVAGSFMIVKISSVTAFFIGIFILGAGYSMCETTISAAVADFNRDKKGKYLNIVQGFFSLGAVAGPLVSNYAMSRLGFDWRIVFTICGLSFSGSLLMLIFTEFGKPFVILNSSPFSQQQEKKKPAYVLLFCPVFGILLFSIIIYITLESGLGYFFDYLFVHGLGKPEFSAFAISLFWLAMIASRFLAGCLFRFQKAILLVSFLIMAVFSFVIAFNHDPSFSLACCFILGFAAGPIWPFIIGIAAQEFPKNTGMATGALIAGCGFGGALSPVLMGYGASLLGINISFAALALAALTGCGTILIYYKLKRTDTK